MNELEAGGTNMRRDLDNKEEELEAGGTNEKVKYLTEGFGPRTSRLRETMRLT